MGRMPQPQSEQSQAEQLPQSAAQPLTQSARQPAAQPWASQPPTRSAAVASDAKKRGRREDKKVGMTRTLAQREKQGANHTTQYEENMPPV
jgi:hypothetical protein